MPTKTITLNQNLTKNTFYLNFEFPLSLRNLKIHSMGNFLHLCGRNNYSLVSSVNNC